MCYDIFLILDMKNQQRIYQNIFLMDISVLFFLYNNVYSIRRESKPNLLS